MTYMKGALLVGIDEYPGTNALRGCVNDATALAALLENNEDGSANFQVELRCNVKTKGGLKKMISDLLHADLHIALFYFAGHGCITDYGGRIVTPDYASYDEGISMDELLLLCNNSPIKEKIIIMDCCHSGRFGNLTASGASAAYLGSGITILASCSESEKAVEKSGHGLFTSLLLEALRGGAADIAGKITTGSIYAFIDRSLGFWQQRPQFKTNVSRFMPLRAVKPAIPATEVLKKITEFFTTPENIFPLAPSFEYTNEDIAIESHVEIFKKLQKMQSVGLVIPDGEEHMYWAAQNSKGCKLTPLGKHYWKLAKDNRI
ncbi:MAG: Caspase protein [Mucilaginibacter sp.]|nr:Caspase protein [Mucilaginibacter sp.]